MTTMKRLIWALPAIAALTACATGSSGVAPLGDGRYVVRGSDLTGWNGSGDVKVLLLRDAEAHCAKLGKELTGVRTTGLEANLIRSASAEVTFRCK